MVCSSAPWIAECFAYKCSEAGSRIYLLKIGKRDCEAITSAVMVMAKKLGLKVIAEGWITPDYLNYLRENQCNSPKVTESPRHCLRRRFPAFYRPIVAQPTRPQTFRTSTWNYSKIGVSQKPIAMEVNRTIRLSIKYDFLCRIEIKCAACKAGIDAFLSSLMSNRICEQLKTHP